MNEFNKLRALSLPEELRKRVEHNQRMYNSLHTTGIEGNSISSMEEMELIISNKVPKAPYSLNDMNEVNDSYNTEVLASSLKFSDLDVAKILRLHHWVTRRTIQQEDRGRWRDERVQISGAKILFPTSEEVPKLMDKYIRYIHSDAIKKASPTVQACLVHAEFIRIHPFIDGNGRVGRLIMQLLFRELGYPDIVILRDDQARYKNLLNVHFTMQKNGTFETSTTTSPFCDYIESVVVTSIARADKELADKMNIISLNGIRIPIHNILQ